MTYFSLQVEGTVLNAHMLNGRIINLGILCSGNTTQTQHCLLFKFQGTMKCKCDFINTHNRMLSNASGLSFFSLLKLSSLCCYVFTFWYLYLYFLHLFYITGHLYYVTVLKILFLRFKYRITTINVQDISVGNSMICSDTWNKHHEWCFKIVKRKIWDNFEMARVVFTPNITCKSCY